VIADVLPAAAHQSTTQHLTSLLDAAGVSWKSYAENISGSDCPLTASGFYTPTHVPSLYFDDQTNGESPLSATCITHARPFSELATDLQNDTVARYNFITPNECDDMRSQFLPACTSIDFVKNGDTWLSQNVPAILSSAAYQDDGALFITWDEGTNSSDGPIGMIALSPLAKAGYANAVSYDHSSTLRTIEEIFGLTPLLRSAAYATDLSDLFGVAPSIGGTPPSPV
jgi:phospholipase C